MVKFSTFLEFMEALGAAFVDPDSYATAERELEGLFQDSSCAAYYARAVLIFTRLG